MCDTADGRRGWTYVLPRSNPARGRPNRDRDDGMGHAQIEVTPGGIRRPGEAHAAVDAGLRELINRERTDTVRPP